MAVVINDFEAVAEAPPTQPTGQEARREQGGGTSARPEPRDIAPVLHVLAQQALRCWAH